MFVNIYLSIRSFIRHHILHIDDRSQLEIAISNGLRIGADHNIQDGCIIDPGHCWLIEIGDRVTFAPRVHVLAHDASTKRLLGYTRLGEVSIGNDVFVGAGTIILPNVNIGNNVVIGAGSVVTHDVPSGSVAVGNPARVIGTIDDYIKKRQEQMYKTSCYDYSYTIGGNVTSEKKDKMIRSIKENGIAFVQ